MPRKEHRDLTGETFTYLVVQEYLGAEKKGKKTLHFWRCECKGTHPECKKEHITTSALLLDDKVKSCGCLYKERHLKALDPRRAKNALYHTYKYNASSKGRAFDFTKEEFWEIQSKDCYYCGTPPLQEHKVGKSVYIYNGIDRLDPKEGYTFANSVPCCGLCNQMKGTMTLEEFKKWILAITHKQGVV